MEDLNNDVLGNILFRLPLGAAAQAKRVCKSWKTILDSKRHNEVGFLFACNDYRDNKIQVYFGEEYDHIDVNKMKNYYSPETIMEVKHCSFVYKYFQYQGDILVGSCNGLVCFQKLDPHTEQMAEPFAICNPLTGEFIFLKANLSRVWNEAIKVASGFGYCQSTKEYKVVRLYTFDGYRSSVQVYTLGSNKWRDIETSIMHTFASPGIFANGFLLWLELDYYRGSYITAFDLEDENFQALPLPPSEDFEGRGSHFVIELKLLGGNLCLVKRKRTDSHINIWAYKKIDLNTNGHYLGNSWNWVKEFSIECDDHEPFAITKSNQIILLDTYNNFYCFDPKSTQTLGKHGDDNGGMGWNNSYTQVIPHTNSYISLRDFGETWYGPGCSAVPQTNSSVSLTEVRDVYYGCHKRIMDPYCQQCCRLCGHTLLKDFVKTLYGPEEVSAVPQTNSSVSLTEVRDAYVECHEGIMDPYCQECGELCGHTYVPWIYNQ